MKKSDIPHAWFKEADKPGPFVVVSGGIHGDETPGIKTVNELLEIIDQVNLERGKIVLSLGNVVAMEAGLRSLHPRDLNKCFGSEMPLLDGKPTYEVIRAQQLKAAWAGADVLLDLHATIKPSKPFLVVPNLANRPMAKWLLPHLGIPTVVTGKGLFPPSGDPIYADTFVDALGGLGVTVEAGWAKDPSLTDLTERVMKVLVAIGILPGVADNPTTDLEMWDASQNVIAGPEFHFSGLWNNFDQVSAGTRIADDSNGPVIAEHDSIILFPKPPEKIVEGQEACILARFLTN